MTTLPNLDTRLSTPLHTGPTHPPRILLLYGSTRPRSFSRLLVEEAARLLSHFGADTRIFNPSGLPLPDDAPNDHPKVQELLDLMQWSEGQVWCSPSVMARCRQCSRHNLTGCRWRWVPYGRPRARPGGDASVRRLAILQHRQSTACAGALDAHVHYSQSILGAQSIHGV